ncbi:MAG: hypothetical protein OXF64_02095, partial [bacterium]|nr:hypothetical protein [bacterium]
AEESYEGSSVGEFWLECLAHVADQAARGENDPDLHRTMEELRTIGDDRILGDRCLGALQDFSDREGKRLVLLVENLNMMFKDMSDPEAGWRLRKVFQTEPRIVLLASSTSRFDEIDDPEHALYEQLRMVPLRALGTNECGALWETVSGRPTRPGMIRSLEILTGGSPRLITIVARFGSEISFRKLMASLLDLIDDHTGYLKSHLESLPAQERRVYLALAALWKPATTREISDQARLDTNKCSAQLKRLVERGAVQTAGGSARRKQYYLTERLYNIYYLLRRSRSSDHLVDALIRFMESYYSPSELMDISTRIIHDAESFATEMQPFSRATFARLLELSVLASYREELMAMVPEGFIRAMHQDSIHSDTGKWTQAETSPDSHRTDHRHEDANERTELMAAAKTLANIAVAMFDRDRAKEILSAFDEMVDRFLMTEHSVLRELAGHALIQKGEIEWRFEQHEATVETVSRALDLLSSAPPEERVRGHLIRAKAAVAYGDRSACERDVEAVLALMQPLEPLPKESVDALVFCGAALGAERMCELIKGAPAANLLLPLTTALELELGLEPRVALEVREVAEDIRRDLAKLREAGAEESGGEVWSAFCTAQTSERKDA